MKRLVVTLFLPCALSVAGAQSVPQWRATELWRVGGEVEGPHAFEDVRDLEVLPDGRFLVLDFKQQQLFILGPQGQPVRTIGRAGSGPSEFRNANGFAIAPNGEIVVNDPSNGRFTVLSPNGDFARTVPVSGWGFGFQWAGAFNRDGRLEEPVPFRAPGSATSVPGMRAYAADLASFEVREIPVCPAGPPLAPGAGTIELRGARGGMMMSVPFLAPPRGAATAPDGTYWVGIRPDFRVLEARRSGSCAAAVTITLAGQQRRVPDAERNAVIENIRSTATTRGVPPPDFDRIPRVLPYFESLHTDSEGCVWVERRDDDDGRYYEIFSAEGRLIGNVRLPFRVSQARPVIILRDRIVAFTTDEDGVSYLVALRIDGRGT